MHAELLDIFGQIADLETSEEEAIKERFTLMKLSKGEFFLQEGEINTHVGFLKKGLVRYFVFNKEEESTFEFTKEGEFIADYQSFNNHRPSIQNIQAIENCELLIINYDDVQNIFNTTQNGNLIGRRIIEHRFDIMVGQLLAIYMQNHEERYKNFMDTYSDLIQRVPQYMIASYVGVKPESLSRIRRRFLKNIS